jgi:hypothetical protein
MKERPIHFSPVFINWGLEGFKKEESADYADYTDSKHEKERNQVH